MNMTREVWDELHSGNVIIDYKGQRWSVLERLSGNKLKMDTPMEEYPQEIFIFDSEVGVLHEASRSNVTALSRDIKVVSE